MVHNFEFECKHCKAKNYINEVSVENTGKTHKIRCHTCKKINSIHLKTPAPSETGSSIFGWIVAIFIIAMFLPSWGLFSSCEDNGYFSRPFCIIGTFFNEEQSASTQQIDEDSVYVPQPEKNDGQLVQKSIQSDKDSIDYESGKFTREFDWNYGGHSYGVELNLYPQIYKIFKDRERTRDYDLFASDAYSKEYIKSLTEELANYGERSGLGKDQIPYFIVSFVQSLPYTSDKVTTGFDEYPRFPYETFYDDGGDCEDTSILAAAMLNELGYGAALIELPGHMAAGVKCDGTWGSYYTHNGIRYCYLETTGENWDVGQIPPEYQNENARIIPVVERPYLDVDFNSNYRYNRREVYTDVDVTVKNLGSESANNVKIYVALQTQDQTKVWSDIESKYLQLDPEEIYSYKVTNLHSSNGQTFRVYVRAYGDNIVSDEAVSNWIYWN